MCITKANKLERYTTDGEKKFSVQLDGKYDSLRTTVQGAYNLVIDYSKSKVNLFDSKGNLLRTYENSLKADFSKDEKSILLLDKDRKTIKSIDLLNFVEEWSIKAVEDVETFKDLGNDHLFIVNRNGEACFWSTKLKELLHKEYRSELAKCDRVC